MSIKVEPGSLFNPTTDGVKPPAKKSNDNGGTKTNRKTIKAPGSKTERVAQACDRCRAKKTKCDGRNPCSTCQAVGLECIVSDKLSRKAFPKGYTETLEERVRQLEAENKKLVSILDMRDEQIVLLNNTSKDNYEDQSEPNENQKITTDNLNLLNNIHSHLHDHENGCPCGCSNPHNVHEQPVSIAGSIYDSGAPISIAGSINLSDDEFNDETDSLFSIDEYNNKKQFSSSTWAAATAIAQMQKNKLFQEQQQKLEQETNKQRMLTSLVAISIPRSTEETLTVPTLLARICQAYGYDSKPAILTANSLASLKEIKIPICENTEAKQLLHKLIMNRDDLQKLGNHEALIFIKDLLNLPASRLDMDQLITVFFQEWGNTLPIINKNSFLKDYMKLINVLESNLVHEFQQIEVFGAIMILVLSLGFLTSKNNYLDINNRKLSERYSKLFTYYDYLIHEFIKPNCIITQYCSITSLQILSLALQYCLVIGDIQTCYDLRGRVISMAQQLRLHRCPAAVLGISGNSENLELQNYMQGERRILFWCIYCLDVYSSLNLGIPRLLKDYEIECAMPFSGKNDDDEEDNVNILVVNNMKLSIVGKVSKVALSMMLYSKVLANILDSIYSRFESGDDLQKKALHKDRLLDCWRRELPSDLKFEIDINGLSLKDGNNNFIERNIWDSFNKQQLVLIFLYYHAKILIYLPIISKYGNHHNVGLSQKEQLAKGENEISTIVSSISLIQQSAIQILEVTKCLANTSSSNILPIPINMAKETVLLALIVAKGTLDYIKGGPLFINSKQLLLDTIKNMSIDSTFGLPGGVYKNSVKLLELTILSILGINLNKTSTNMRKKALTSHPIVKTAVEREPKAKQTAALQNPLNNFDLTSTEMFNMSSSESNILNSNSTTSDQEFILNPQDTENLESLFDFDPFKVNLNLNRQNMMSEFVTDYSVGVVPYLDMPNTNTTENRESNHNFLLKDHQYWNYKN
ncbi:unnamed protein product [Candida verbasci]|uniref:Zn(2)-C6 fungal-type domain-containing protein n=1 Tax=Candida verbasci TaxID=1227364 RepID=A0A9W4XCB1_9ASCO|nr:unnamed protein product [Candida verbasci]